MTARAQSLGALGMPGALAEKVGFPAPVMLSAAGTDATDAAQIVSPFSVVTTIVDGSANAVRLPRISAALYDEYVVVNGVGDPLLFLLLYPYPGDLINGHDESIITNIDIFRGWTFRKWNEAGWVAL